jgi:hypothetical protein
MRREFNHGDDLLVGQVEPLHNLADRGAHFQIIEHHGNRRSCVPEDPCATSLAGNTFHSGTMPSRQWFESGGRRHRALEHRLPGANGYRDPPNRPDRRLSLFPSMLSIELFSEGI